MDLTKSINELAQIVRLADTLTGLSTDKLHTLYEAAQEVMRASAEYLVRANISEEQVRALLTVIFQDDGETQVKFGTQRAVIDAIITAQAQRMELARYRGADVARVSPQPPRAAYTETGEQ